MQPIDQLHFITDLENETENQLREVLEVFQNLPESALLQPSSTGGWSIAQCFEHLNTYAEFYEPRIKKSIAQSSDVSTPPMFKHSWLGNYFIKMMDIERSKKKYKAIKKHRPNKIENPHEVISTFIQHTEDLLNVLKLAKTKELGKTSVTTSISTFIHLNAGDALKFVLTHNRRHLEQAKRNL